MTQKQENLKTFTPLEDVKGRKFIETKNGKHYYEKLITKGSGTSQVQKTSLITIPASLQTLDTPEKLEEFINAAQRQLIADKSNYIRQNELLTDADREKKTQNMKNKFSDLLSGLSPEDRERILKDLKEV